jgi:hypothetical protein
MSNAVRLERIDSAGRVLLVHVISPDLVPAGWDATGWARHLAGIYTAMLLALAGERAGAWRVAGLPAG